MPEATRTPAADKLFDSIAERQATMFDVVRGAAERYHRFNQSLLTGARQNTIEWTEVGRRWVSNPTDVVGVYEAVAEAISNLQARNIALAREWFEDRAEAQRETRDMLRQGFGDVREAVQRAQEGAPAFLRNFARRRNGHEEPVGAAADS